MEIDEEALKELIDNLEDWLDEFNAKMKGIIDNMRKAKSVEEVMKLKKEMLLKILDMMPLSASYCYFCILHFEDCSECIYSDYHGSCIDLASDYVKIMDKKRELWRMIDELYYKGEKYD